MSANRTRKVVNTTLDPDLVAWLHEWRKAQPTDMPLGRALDACILALREKQESRKSVLSNNPVRPRGNRTESGA